MPSVAQMAELEWRWDRIGHIDHKPSLNFNSRQEIDERQVMKVHFRLADRYYLLNSDI